MEAELIEVTVPEEEWLAELQREMTTAHGELVGWDQAILDAGLVRRVETVSPQAGDRRVHALVDARRPNSSGKVPISGPY
jgi:hypothetical protein